MSLLNSRYVMSCGAFVSLGFNGLLLSFMGTSLPALQQHLGMSISESSVMMGLFQVGFTLFILVAGLISDLVACAYILVLGCVLSAIGAMLLGSGGSFVASCLPVLCMGAGIGAILSGSNSLLVKLFPEKRVTILNIHHVFFGVGAFTGPALMGSLITHGNQWRLGYLASGVLLLTLSVLFAITGRFEPAGRQGGTSFMNQVSTLLGDRRFTVISLVNGLSMGAQVTVMLLGVSFLIDAKQVTLVHAGYALSWFSALLVVGRIICSRLAAVIPATRLVLALLAMQTVATVLIFTGSKSVAVAALAFSGFSFSGVYPTLLAVAGSLFPGVSGAALGILSTVGGLGSVGLCWLTGYVAGGAGIQRGFLVLVAASFLSVGIFILTYRGLGREDKTSAVSYTGNARKR